MAPPPRGNLRHVPVLAQSWLSADVPRPQPDKLLKTARVIDNGGGRMLRTEKVEPRVRFAVPDGKTIELRVPAK